MSSTPINKTATRCPLCYADNPAFFFSDGKKPGSRDFHHCSICDLVFVPERYHLDSAAQKKRYLTHNNDPKDLGYRTFLSRLLDPLRPFLAPGAKGLDFGAGPGPALAMMIREEGFNIHLYDPIFHPNPSTLEQTYDFITCTETAEHLVNPIREFQILDRMLRPLGWLGVMTGMLESWNDFAEWYYHRDPTHICFYSKCTMQWVANVFSWDIHFPRQNVVLFRKPNT